ncbi:unnamed protein product [Discula destructiva]
MSAGAMPSSPTRPRHQVSRSINERVSGSSKPTNTSSSTTSHHHHHHHHITGHISSSLPRRDRSRDGRNGSTVVPQSAATITPRASLEASRPEGGMTASLTPGHSRTGSLVYAGNDVLNLSPGAGLSREEQMLREARKTETRTAGFKKSLVDLATFSTTTTRRLDETYYSVLEKLTTLQNTIVALKDLAHASATTNNDFVAEAHIVLTEAQSQLDGFGDFAEQQARVQALQDRVHGGRERIAALSARVDVVRQRVEKWERADREWQETTRRRLKIMWGVLLGVGLVLLLLYWGARAYAPEIDGVMGELQQDALLARMKLEGKAADVGLDMAVGKENGSLPSVNLGRGGRAAHGAGQEALRALDEL